jgi:hypothetical protein
LSAPQVGIASALGLATIAAPISGALGSAEPKPVINPLPIAAPAPAPEFPAREVAPSLGVEDVQVVPITVLVGDAPQLLTAPRTLIVTRASRDGERSVLPGCSGVRPEINAANGQLPSSVLCTLWDAKNRLRADAAVAIAKLNVAYRQRFGKNLCITDTYRTLASQYRVKALKGGLAAAPGTSNHGWGVAIDFCGGIESSGSATHQWMKANAPAYGWHNPNWAIGWEPWHWEYDSSLL